MPNFLKLLKMSVYKMYFNSLSYNICDIYLANSLIYLTSGCAIYK